MKIVGAMVCGPGEADRYLDRTLEYLEEVCDDILIACNNVDEKTKKAIQDSKARWYLDDREWGKEQHRIKETLVRSLANFHPDWVVMLDADEVLQVDRSTLEVLASTPHDIAYSFWCIELWDNEDTYREDITFETVRFWKYLPENLHWLQTPLHNGNAPAFNAKWGTSSEFTMLHYGLMDRGERERRYARYEKYDPNHLYLEKGWYEGLLSEDVPLRKVDNFPWQGLKTHFRTKTPQPMNNLRPKEKVARMMNPHGMIYEEKERHIKQRERDGHKFIEWITLTDEPPQPPPIVKDELECEICGFLAKSKAGIVKHEKSHE